LWRDQEAADRIHDRRFFQDFLRRAFTLRRKFIRSVLVALYRKELDKAEIDVLLGELGHTNEDRAERMDIPTLIRLSNHLLATIRKKGAEVEIESDDEDVTETTNDE
jgi:16S rRNA (adenine1518-N6/adenine1519-N6)-dimethyltransferase